MAFSFTDFLMLLVRNRILHTSAMTTTVEATYQNDKRYLHLSEDLSLDTLVVALCQAFSVDTRSNIIVVKCYDEDGDPSLMDTTEAFLTALSEHNKHHSAPFRVLVRTRPKRVVVDQVEATPMSCGELERYVSCTCVRVHGQVLMLFTEPRDADARILLMLQIFNSLSITEQSRFAVQLPPDLIKVRYCISLAIICSSSSRGTLTSLMQGKIVVRKLPLKNRQLFQAVKTQRTHQV
jgi:hypothetical protein